MKDNLKLWGRLQIWQETPDGRSLVYDDYNLILNSGKLNVLNSLCGDTTGYISEMAIGNDGTQSPAVDDTSLSNEVDSKVFGSVSKDSVNRIIEFRTSWSSGDYDATDFSPYNQEINEAALKWSDGTLFSRRTFNSRPFAIADLVVLTFNWTIGVA